jgi:hypothetical protein
MKIRRLTLTLPARMKDTAHHDARAIAEAVAQGLHKNGGQTVPITLQGHGQTASVLATRAAAKLPTGGKNGG